VLGFLHPLPVTVLWGVGARTAQPLRALGIRTIGELAAIPSDTLRRAVGSAAAHHLGELAAGRDPRAVQEREVEKSISADRTYDTDLTEVSSIHRELLRLSDDVAGRLRSRGLVARTVGIKIRFADFRTVTRVRTLPEWVAGATELYDAALELYASLGLDRPRIRLVGVKSENFLPAQQAPQQLSFDLSAPPTPGPGPTPPRPRAARMRLSPARDVAAMQAATDAVRARFGSAAVRSATLLPPGERPGSDAP
jgi:DNA polymerase-4